MTEYFVAPIVEGHGEVQAVPILLRRFLAELRDDAWVRVNPSLRIKAGSFLNDEAYFTKHLELAARKAKKHERGSVLILLDCDDACPAELGPEIAAKASALRPDVPITVVLAYREYETWFLAAAQSLRGVAGLPNDLEPPPDIEAIRGAKGWLAARMPNGYNEPNDQPGFTATFSFEEAAKLSSFSRLRAKLEQLFTR